MAHHNKTFLFAKIERLGNKIEIEGHKKITNHYLNMLEWG